MMSSGAAAAAEHPGGRIEPVSDESRRNELVELIRVAQDDLRRVELQIRRGAADEYDRETALEQLRYLRAQLQCMDEEVAAEEAAGREASEREAEHCEQAKAEAIGEAAARLVELGQALETKAGELRNMVAEFHRLRLSLWNALPKDTRSLAAVSVAFDDGTWRGILSDMAASITGSAGGNYVAAEADRRFGLYLAAAEAERSLPPLT